MSAERQSPAANAALNIVTGAFGFSGSYIARRLLSMGQRVRTLTNHPRPDSELADQIETAPLDFSRPDELARAMSGAAVLYNTYWVRFAHGAITHQQAVENSRRLIRAAERAGIARIVHISITNPALDSPLPYFRGKAEVEEAVRASRLSYAILRPALLFGEEDILLNNIAWLLRHFPVFAIPGAGNYRVQPIFVDDLAALAIASAERHDSFVLDAVGPEIQTYNQIVQLVRQAVHSRSRIIHLPAAIVVLASSVLSRVVHDVVLTRDEVRGLMADLLVSTQPPTAPTSLRAWVEAHAETLGTNYASELARHYTRTQSPGAAIRQS